MDGGLFGGGLFGGGLFGGGLFVGGLFAGGLFPGRPFWSYPGQTFYVEDGGGDDNIYGGGEWVKQAMSPQELEF